MRAFTAPTSDNGGQNGKKRGENQLSLSEMKSKMNQKRNSSTGQQEGDNSGTSRAQQALHLLDQRRIRRQAVVRDFDLAPDDEELPEEELREIDKKLRHQFDEKIDSAADFRLFGRLIPRGTFRDHTRMYLLSNFPNLAEKGPHTMHLSEDGQDGDDDDEDGDDDRDSSDADAERRPIGGPSPLPAASSKAHKSDTSSSSINHKGSGVGGISATTTAKSAGAAAAAAAAATRLNKARFAALAREGVTHRQLLDASLGELSADFASISSGDKFRKLIRSCSPDLETMESDLLSARETLPLRVAATTKFIPGAFPDRPPSPRTINLQRRRVRLSELFHYSCDHNRILNPLANPVAMLWQWQYLFKGATLVPVSSFFSINGASASAPQASSSPAAAAASATPSGSNASPGRSDAASSSATATGTDDHHRETEEQHSADNDNNNNNNSNKTTIKASPTKQTRQAISMVIRPDLLLFNLRESLPFNALSERDSDWLMMQMAPDYQCVVEQNKDAAKRAKNPSLLVTLAKTRRDACGKKALDPELARMLKKHEDECRALPLPTEPISTEAAYLRLCRAIRPSLSTFSAANSSRSGDHHHHYHHQQHSMHRPAEAMSTKARGGGDNLGQQYDNDDQQSLALLCYSALLPRALRSSRAVTGANASTPPPAITTEWLSLSEAEYAAVGMEEMQRLVKLFRTSWHLHFCHLSLGVDCSSLVMANSKSGSIYQGYDHDQYYSHGNDDGDADATSPSPFPEELAEFLGETECPVCCCTGIESNYNYIDHNVLSAIREEARGDFVEQLELQVLKVLSRSGSLKAPPRRPFHQQQFDGDSDEHGKKNDADEDDDPRTDSASNTARNTVSGTVSTTGSHHQPQQKHTTAASLSTAKSKSNGSELLHQAWRCEFEGLNADLKDFETNDGIVGRRTPGGATSSRDGSGVVSTVTLNNRYFDCFVTHYVSSPLFASLMASLTLKQLVVLGGGARS